MRVLIVSFFFPPFNAIGAVRAGKMAKFLTRLGHDVRVLTARDQPLQASLPVEVPEAHVLRTRWIDVNRPAEWLSGGRQAVAARGYGNGASAAGGHWSARSYRALVHVPDAQVGWIPFGIREGRRLVSGWRPEVVYASSSPFSSLIVGQRVAYAAQVPWVAEFRDLWHGNPFQDPPAWRSRLDAAWERAVVAHAGRIVTVSDGLAETLRHRHGLPVDIVRNGFDPEDYPRDAAPPANGGPLELVYTGIIYHGRRDPTPLFRALAEMGAAASDIRVSFYGRYTGIAGDLARAQGVEHLVRLHGQVPYTESLGAQARADALLFLSWNDAADHGYLTGKLFEYLGARRPILCIGALEGEAADLIREHRAGTVVNDPRGIAEQLGEWLALKQVKGGLPPPPATATAGLTRADQARRLEQVLAAAASPARVPEGA